MGLKDTCNWTKHNFCCFCSQCDPWKVRFTYSNIFSAQTDLNIYKQPWFRIKWWFQFFFQSLSNFWNPFKDVEKQCHGRPAIGGHLTNQFCQRGGGQGQDFQHISQNQILSFFSRLLSAFISKINFTKKENENRNIFQRFDSRLEKTTVSSGLVFVSPFDKTILWWMWKIRARFVKIFHIIWWLFLICSVFRIYFSSVKIL